MRLKPNYFEIAFVGVVVVVVVVVVYVVVVCFFVAVHIIGFWCRCSS